MSSPRQSGVAGHGLLPPQAGSFHPRQGETGAPGSSLLKSAFNLWSPVISALSYQTLVCSEVHRNRVLFIKDSYVYGLRTKHGDWRCMFGANTKDKPAGIDPDVRPYSKDSVVLCVTQSTMVDRLG